MRYFGILRSAEWLFLADVSGQLIGPIFKGHKSQKNSWTNGTCKMGPIGFKWLISTFSPRFYFVCDFQKLPTVLTKVLTAYPPAEFSRLKEWCVLRDNSLRCRIDFCTASSTFIDVVPWEQGQNHGNRLYFEQ
jgi:hypothetical protein